MINLIVVYSLPYAVIVIYQFFLGELYILKIRKMPKAGYVVVMTGFFAGVVYGVYVMQFVEFLEALGIAQIVLSLYLFYNFLCRYGKQR
jgi:uncharacterized membrane protein YoaK (UPF0700 family)